MLFARIVHNAADGLALFAQKRTNTRKKGKLQGVETPSQVRYMYNFEELLQQQNCYAGNHMKVLRAPDPQRICLLHVKSFAFYPTHTTALKQPMTLSAEIQSKRHDVNMNIYNFLHQ